jgi:hypothetical protein
MKYQKIVITFVILLLALSSFATSLYSKELNKLSIHPEVDNSIIVDINVGNEYVDIFTIIAGYRFNKEFKLIEKFIELDTTLANVVRINSVDYLNDKIYIGTHHYGLLVLNKNLEIVDQYTAENSKLDYSKSCGTSYDSTNGSIISKTCGLSLFHIDKNGKQQSSFLNWGNIDEFCIIDNQYYISFTSFYDIKPKGNIVKTNNEFEVLDTIRFNSEIDFYDYHRVVKIKQIENYICYYLLSDLVVIENKISGEYNYLNLNDFDIKFLLDFKEIDGNLALCTTNGIFEYDFDKKSIKQFSINNGSAGRLDSHFRDLDKFGVKSYLAASGNGIYILDKTTTVSEYQLSNRNQYYYFENNVLISNSPSIKLEIFSANGQQINSFNNFTSINPDNLIRSTGVYHIVISVDNNIVGVEKFVKLN